ncbi:conserved hypothetical protein [Streptomyces scabiei 87.22]|uniref:Uncharacterized protein n=1 Tax=Streptomyces scabiei (strain 87.22) TaxID=680198 RepID=C9ZA60_STRSW|nr:conserved hypothetical protein [Streptomyces scabiei 87.22]
MHTDQIMAVGGVRPGRPLLRPRPRGLGHRSSICRAEPRPAVPPASPDRVRSAGKSTCGGAYSGCISAGPGRNGRSTPAEPARSGTGSCDAARRRKTP